MTKYDCSSGEGFKLIYLTITINFLPADINPIGGISKTDLKRFITYARDAFDLPIMNELVSFPLMDVCKQIL